MMMNADIIFIMRKALVDWERRLLCLSRERSDSGMMMMNADIIFIMRKALMVL
jgi:hypothetical protein